MDNLKRYRITPHHSELAVKVFGSTQVELFQNSGWALFDVLADIEKIESKDSVPLEVEGTDRDDLLVNWVRELLYLYQAGLYKLQAEFLMLRFWLSCLQKYFFDLHNHFLLAGHYT